MKKILLSAAIALFAVSAFAQSNSASKKQKDPNSQSTDKAAKDKDWKFDGDQYDVNQDGDFSPEEREARRAAKMAWKENRKADRNDDGILNGSAGHPDNHGSDVSSIARGTTLEGREKGERVRDVARSNGKSRERMQGASTANKPAKVGRTAGAGRTTGAGRKN
ncbi:hypothetical protein [Daejeonella lutea]|uniref:Uncharacterized protein n=1 Tax=Daejeonella lutea TaxID=572036 RepID=A0A1T5AY11_9SPHI|nr:hypothetical protein [Daejeonella lutea]SKB39865.1 hypothetical protein SAMN05661099_1116 [Daejeonella lutea]